MFVSITQALTVYALACAVATAVAAMIKGLFLLVRRLSRSSRK